jgi:hypothetical protein
MHPSQVEECGSRPGRGAERGEHQTRVVGQILPVHARVTEALPLEHGLQSVELASSPVAVAVARVHGSELLIGGDGGPQLEEPGSAPSGYDQPAGLGEVGREAVDLLALESRLSHQGHVTHGEVAEAAVDQLRGAARGARRVVLRFQQGHREPTQGGFAGDSRACDAPADHEAVEPLPLEAIEYGGTVRGCERVGGSHPGLPGGGMGRLSR